MFNANSEGKQFIQGIFYDGESFGEPPLFTNDERYPATAIAGSDLFLARLQKASFFEMQQQNYEVHLHITKVLSDRLRFKAIVNREISGHEPEHRLFTLLNYFKNAAGNLPLIK